MWYNRRLLALDSNKKLCDARDCRRKEEKKKKKYVSVSRFWRRLVDRYVRHCVYVLRNFVPGIFNMICLFLFVQELVCY